MGFRTMSQLDDPVERFREINKMAALRLPKRLSTARR